MVTQTMTVAMVTNVDDHCCSYPDSSHDNSQAVDRPIETRVRGKVQSHSEAANEDSTHDH